MYSEDYSRITKETMNIKVLKLIIKYSNEQAYQ